jgi:Domain of unknown function (DUF4418)
MSRTVALISVAAGGLLIAVPWIFPACAHAGAITGCAATARAEMAMGVLLVAVGALAFDARRPAAVAAHAVASSALLAAAWAAPGIWGYCPSPRMACHYGMVPAARFVAVLAGTILLAVAATLANAVRRSRSREVT